MRSIEFWPAHSATSPGPHGLCGQLGLSCLRSDLKAASSAQGVSRINTFFCFGFLFLISCVCVPLDQPAMTFPHVAALRFLPPRRSRTANCRNCRSREETRVNSSRTPSVCTPVRISAFVTCQDACPSEPEHVCLSAWQDASIRLEIDMGHTSVFSFSRVKEKSLKRHFKGNLAQRAAWTDLPLQMQLRGRRGAWRALGPRSACPGGTDKQ